MHRRITLWPAGRWLEPAHTGKRDRRELIQRKNAEGKRPDPSPGPAPSCSRSTATAALIARLGGAPNHAITTDMNSTMIRQRSTI
jgi:hypothetical protein